MKELNENHMMTTVSFNVEGRKISEMVTALRGYLLSKEAFPATVSADNRKSLSLLREAIITHTKDAVDQGLFYSVYAQGVVFVYVWHYLAGRCSKEKQNLYLDRMIACIPASVSPLRELLASLRHCESLLETNFQEQLKRLGEDLKNKTALLSGEETAAIMGLLFEAFLKHYAPGLQKSYGVYSTPLPLVDFMTRSLHHLVKGDFHLTAGIAAPVISLLDPAAGTGVFLDTALHLAVKTMTGNPGQEKIKEFTRHFPGKQCCSFEKLFIPYILNVLCLCDRVAGENPSAGENPDIRVHWRNILEMDIDTLLAGLTGQKGKNAERIIPVIVGNPPYAVHSANNHTPASVAIKAYFSIAGKRLAERNFKALQDDYIKFIRQAQLLVEKVGRGIIAFVTNNAYLDNITFRGMRHSLMRGFNEIYILNLNGESRHEKVPGNSGGTGDKNGDKNIFNTGMGTAVSFFIKQERKTAAGECKVYYAEITGNKAEKFRFLRENDVASLDWEASRPKKDFFLFRPVRESLKKASPLYRHFFKLTEIFKERGLGIVTARDKLTIRYSAAEMLETVTQFAKMDEGAARHYFKLGPDTRDWNFKWARLDVLEHGPDRARIAPILYRPFDIRYTYYTGRCRGFLCMPRWDIMRHLLLENIALITVRQVKAGKFNHCFAASSLIESRVTTNNRGISYVFPLYTYRYPPEEKGKWNPALNSRLLTGGATETLARLPNINPEFFDLLVNTVGFREALKVEQVFYYIYGVLFSNKYRETWSGQLRVDFPCVPFTTDAELFIEVSRLGEELCGLHLFTSPRLQETVSSFPGEGDCLVKRQKVRFVAAEEGESVESLESGTGRVYINENRYFDNIPLAVWECELCGYRVLAKWLKIRGGVRLSADDIGHFNRMVRALQLTIDNRERIDKLYDGIEKRLLMRN